MPGPSGPPTLCARYRTASAGGCDESESTAAATAADDGHRRRDARRGQTWLDTESDLRAFVRWCTDQDLDPLAGARADIERYVRWLQYGGYQPSTVDRAGSLMREQVREVVADAALPVVRVGVAYAAGFDPHQRLAGARVEHHDPA